MNQQNDTRDNGLIDTEITSRYSEAREGHAPQELDATVLREARRAIRADNRQGSFGAWFRPVAFAVTVGLSLAVVLELSDSGIPGQQPDMMAEPALLPADAQALSRTSLNELKRQQKPGPTGNELEQKLEAGQLADALETAPSEMNCSDQVKTEPRTWWRCIESLRDAGHADAVQRELDQFRQRFPDFEPPG